MKINAALWVALFLIAGLSALAFYKNKTLKVTTPDGDSGGVACTMEAKLCPDGSYVGRTGPKCEFKECPTATSTSTQSGTINGRVTLGPVCPVERIPPDPSCAPRPYETTVYVRRVSDAEIIQSAKTNAQGIFSLIIKPGTYELEAQSGSPYPRCAPQTLTVAADQILAIELSCDTGIR